MPSGEVPGRPPRRFDVVGFDHMGEVSDAPARFPSAEKALRYARFLARRRRGVAIYETSVGWDGPLDDMVLMHTLGDVPDEPLTSTSLH